MEMNEIEISVVVEAHQMMKGAEVQALIDLQLALVGGGSGETIL
jgi:hypothetical protein